MAGFIGGRTSAFDYIGPDLPNNPQNGEMWFDTDGASDGTGEVKVYDGSNDSWEATGFTSHADLTDVTRSAHHPPVDVSGPLTQPSDQSLGLSIGDGLTDSNGTLVAALGNGLGVDSNGQVYIPASTVSQSMLGFDTATQADLNNHADATNNPHNVTDDQTGAASALSNHAGDADAHHAPPGSTNSVGTQSKYKNISGSGSVTISGVVTAVDWSASPNDFLSYSVSMSNAFASTTIASGNTDGTASGTEYPPAAVSEEVSLSIENNDGSGSLDVTYVPINGHSHSI